jgi:hypothetical protein
LKCLGDRDVLEVWLDLRWRDRREEEWRYGERERFFAGDLDLGEVDDLEDWGGW